MAIRAFTTVRTGLCEAVRHRRAIALSELHPAATAMRLATGLAVHAVAWEKLHSLGSRRAVGAQAGDVRNNNEREGENHNATCLVAEYDCFGSGRCGIAASSAKLPAISMLNKRIAPPHYSGGKLASEALGRHREGA